VKPSLSGVVIPTRERVSIRNASLRDIIALAYGINPLLNRFSLTGGPEKILSSRFDITAKQPDDVPPGQALLMLRTLLAERFKLQIHAETRQTPIYAVTVAREGRLGPQLWRSTHDCLAFAKARKESPDLEEPRDANGRFLCRGSYEFNTPEPGAITMRDAGPIDRLVSRAQAFLDRPVVDTTGLTGNFEWVLSFLRTDSLDSPVPSIFTAFREQLGLRLETTTGPVDVLFIDHVEQPTPD
jgi:uncharacterized protein (TIGR03435 family)